MKQYYISRTGGEIRFSYSPSNTVTWSVYSETPSSGWFTWSATNGVLSISCPTISGTDDRSIELMYTKDGESCRSIKVTQNGINTLCTCENIPLTWYNINPSDLNNLPSEGTSFYLIYDNTQCVGGNVSFEKKYNKNWWTLTHSSAERKVTVTIQDVSSRSGTDLTDGLIFSLNGQQCQDITLTQKSWCSHLTAFTSTLVSNIPQTGMTSDTKIGEYSLDSSTYNNKLTISSSDVQLTYSNGDILLNQAIAANTGQTSIPFTINAYMDRNLCDAFTIYQDGIPTPDCGCDDITINVLQ